MATSVIQPVQASPSSVDSPTVTVIRSLDHPLTKRFYLDNEGEVQRENYQNAFTFNAANVPITGIRDLSQVLTSIAGDKTAAVLRGVSKADPGRTTWRTQDQFPEHPLGTHWVMLDIDGEEVPDGMTVVSVDAVRWLVDQKLPSEFRNITLHYQFSGSAGVLDAQGALLKPGLRVHLFFFLDRRVRGDQLSAYLCGHCIDTGFYTIEANKGHVAQFKPGIDPAPIRSAVQVHFVANPIIEEGVNCLLNDAERNGLIDGEKDVVMIPEIPDTLISDARQLQSRLRGDWQRENGYTPKKIQLSNNKGFVSVTYYQPPSAPGEIRRGRTLSRTELKGDKFCRLYFAEEGTPGSYYVVKDQPQLARRYGDGEVIPLKELSEDAYVHIRDERKWFSEVPHRDLALNEQGFVQPFDTFVLAKYSLILAPTSSGKTTAVVDWIREKATKNVVIYVAQTISLVNQMHASLTAAGILSFHYSEFAFTHNPSDGAYVTTNESLPRILGCISNACKLPYHLIIDEIHAGLDDFCQSQKKLETFEKAILQARSVIFMTGTLTDVQRLMISGTVARLEGGGLTAQRYCCYEYAPVKQSPLQICRLNDFPADVVALLQRLSDDRISNRPLPKVMLMLDTSKMEVYRLLLQHFGLEDLTYIVSRPECRQYEIEQARIGEKPIIVSSPLFALGLNFERELEILYCRFAHLDADTSHIIQTINRANRGQVPCEVRIYAGDVNEKPFYFPARDKVIEQFREALADESSHVNNRMDMPLLLDRMVYKNYRQIERNTNQALGQLIRDDSFQNYRIVETTEKPPASKAELKLAKESENLFKALKKEAQIHYDDSIVECLDNVNGAEAQTLFWRLQMLAEERRTQHRAEEQRTDLEIKNDEYAVLMRLCNLDQPAKVRKLSIRQLQTLFGDREPWLSDQFQSSRYAYWGSAAAEKVGKVITVVETIRLMATGQLDGDGFATKLNQDKTLKAGFQALVASDHELVNLDRQLKTLGALRQKARANGSPVNRFRAQELALNLTKELLEPIGVFFQVIGSGKGRRTDFTKPLVPATWNFDAMINQLKQFQTLLDHLWGVERVARNMDCKGLFACPISKCRTCVFFNSACCAYDHPIDWSEEGFGDAETEITTDHCFDFSRKRMPIRVAA